MDLNELTRQMEEFNKTTQVIGTRIVELQQENKQLCFERDDYAAEVTKLRAELDAKTSRLKEIESAVQADDKDLNQMRDGTKLTRSGLVETIMFQKQDLKVAIRERDSALADVTRLREEAREVARLIVGNMNGVEANTNERCALNLLDSIVNKSTPASDRLRELEEDKARLDWLESYMLASSYPVLLKGLSRPQTNGTTIITGIDSGPFQKTIDGPSGLNPLRSAIDAARKESKP